MDPLNYSLTDALLPEASRCKYLGIILCSHLSWADEVNYTVKKAWKARYFTMRILKDVNNNSKSVACTSILCPVLQYGGACWDPYQEGEICELGSVQKKRPDVHIIRSVRSGKIWRRVESYHACVSSSKRNLGNTRGRLLMTDYNGHTI